jgi:hypothetical protein
MSFDFVENFTVLLPDFSKSEIDFSESFNSKHGLIIEVAAIHEGLTSNYNNYSAEELEKALQSWVEPYPKPIILNHDLNTEPIGRVIAAKMDKEDDGSRFIRLQIAITDPVAAQKVLDKRYLTGSVGGRAGNAICSISGEDLASEDDSGRPRVPKYKRGKVYKGKIAYIDMKNISFKEYSFVNQPADQKSGVRSTRMVDGEKTIAHSDSWVAKSSAFVLHMESEDIVSVESNKSVLKDMKKKESKPTYLHLKGAFLSAMALHESESDFSNSDSLLSNEDSENLDLEENHNMDDFNKDEDILAVAAGLSEDLSTIAAAASASDESEVSTEETVEDVASDVVESSDPEDEDDSEVEESSSDDSEEADVPEVVDSENAEKPEESSSDEDEVQEEVEGHDDLKVVEADPEQDVVQLTVKVALLEEENAKLKNALHMTLVERVVDTKINLGIESIEDREKLMVEHCSRTASSLADSLRDLAKVPSKASKRVSGFLMPEVTSEAEVTESEDNVLTIGEDEVIHTQAAPVDSFEQVLVDALMGRRKL